LEELELQHTNSTEKTHDKQEMYAKMALLMFYPYRKLNDLTDDGSYWKKTHKVLQCHLLKKYTKFWEKGFEILQNIEERATLQKHVKCARDPISMSTITKSQTRPTKTKQISQILIRWQTYLKLAR
jgi:hypothetical protein